MYYCTCSNQWDYFPFDSKTSSTRTQSTLVLKGTEFSATKVHKTVKLQEQELRVLLY